MEKDCCNTDNSEQSFTCEVKGHGSSQILVLRDPQETDALHLERQRHDGGM
jgi:hypothetical protein